MVLINKEIAKQITTILLAAFAINAISGIILAIHGSIIFDGTTSIFTEQEYSFNDLS